LATFFLVRHGITQWVEDHILHGITDIPLNETGIRQAEKTARALTGCGAESLYSSPLQRCMQTAVIIGKALKLGPIPMEGLTEMDFGWLEGKPFRDHSSQDYGKVVQFLDRQIHRIVRTISGEPIRKFRRRVLRDWTEIINENKKSNAIVVGHSAVFNTILIHHFGENFPDGKHYYAMNPGCVNEIRIREEGEAALVRFNDTSHLNGRIK